MTEKPSVAKDIAKVIGATQRCNGYFEGNGYLVTWAVGHLVGLAEPSLYGFVPQKEMWSEKREQAYNELPLLPQSFDLVVLEPTKDQFQIIKNLIHRKDVDEIINCGDMGAEGHILQWFIREKAECKKPVRRFCATSMTDEAIKKAMANLRTEGEFANVIKGEFCKKKADWILGMSLSRAESLKYNTGISVGRVQSPTLYFIVKRYFECKNFKITNYYGMDAQFTEGFHSFWVKDTENVFKQEFKDGEGRVLNKGEVAKKQEEIKAGKTGKIIALDIKKKGNDRPQLYDITELQRDANRIFGYTASVTLSTAQALYETQKVLTYPRTDSRYITTDLVPYMQERVKAISGISRYQSVANSLLKDGLNIDKKIVDDSKVTDHHALLPTEKIKGFDMLSMKPSAEESKKGVTAEGMQNILNLVLIRLLVSFSKPYYYEETSVKVQFANDIIFSCAGKKPLQLGWKAIKEQLSGKEETDQDDTENAEQIFPTLTKGQIVTLKDCFITEKKTTPPKLHTEATLLTAMENAGATIEGGAILKGRGIGTQATRAEIIKNLFEKEYVTTEKKGKTNYIVPTSKGLSIIRVLPVELYSPKITADWENKIAEIVKGTLTEQQFMAEFEQFIIEKTNEVKNADTGVVFKKEREVFGYCPWCESDVYRFQKKNEKGKIVETRFYCSSKECSFSISSDNPTVGIWTGKRLTEEQLKRIISKGFVVLDCKKKNGTGTYRGHFTLVKKEVNGKIYANLDCTPVKSKLK